MCSKNVESYKAFSEEDINMGLMKCLLVQAKNDCHEDNGLSFYETTYAQLLTLIDYFSVYTSIYNTILFQCKHVSYNITTKIISGHILYNFHFFKLTCDSQREGKIMAQVQT